MRPDRTDELRDLLERRILILDGAMGTMIQAHRLSEAAFRGERFADSPADLKGANDLLVLTQPAIIRDIHRAYLEAGADIVETNTFGANRIKLGAFSLADRAHAINVQGARIARHAAREQAYVAGADGATLDEPATARALAGFALRALQCGAVTESDLGDLDRRTLSTLATHWG